MSAWWEPFYDELLAEVLLAPQPEAELARSAAFVTDVLALPPGARVFDQCCGLGQLALTLVGEGFELVGVDQAASYVERARASASARGVRAEFHVGDAFEFVADPPCNGAYNWWTSYGYADSDHENEKMIERAFESLRPGARFMLDVPNVPAVLRGFRPHILIRRDTPRGEVLLAQECEIDLVAGVLRKQWIYLLPDGRRVEHPSAVRLQLPSAIKAAFERIGFEDVAFYGSTRREPLGLDSQRCIVVGRRPA
jgi:SAM-dependent methyltransferase